MRYSCKKGLVRSLSIFIMLALVIISPMVAGQVALAANEAPSEISIWGAPPTGIWAPLMMQISELFRKEFPNSLITVQAQGGASAVMAVGNGEGTFAISISTVIGGGVKGAPPFPKPFPNIRALLGLDPQVFQIVTTDPSVKTIADIKGKRVNVGTRGYNVEIIAKSILEEYNITYNDIKVQFLGLGSGSATMMDGHVDVMFRTSMVPVADFVDLANARNIRLIEVPENIRNAMIKKYPGMTKYVIPKGAYRGVDMDISTISSNSAFVVNESLPESVAYRMTKSLIHNKENLAKVYGNLSKLKASDFTVAMGIPYHSGALKCFRELGWIK